MNTTLTDKDVKNLDKVTDGVFELFSRTITSDLINGEYIMARGDSNTYLLGVPGHQEGDEYTTLITDSAVSSLFSGDTLLWFIADAKGLRKALRSTKDEGKLKLRTHSAQDYTDNILFSSYSSDSYVQDTPLISQNGVLGSVWGSFEIGINKRQYANVLAAMEGTVTAYIVLKSYKHLLPSFAVILVEEERKRFAILMGKAGDHEQFSMYSKGIWEYETREILKKNTRLLAWHGINLTEEEHTGLGKIASAVNLDMYWNARYFPLTAAYEIAGKYQEHRAAMIKRIQARDPRVALEYNGEDWLISINGKPFRTTSWRTRDRVTQLMRDCSYELTDSGDEKISIGRGYYARMISRFSMFTRKPAE